MTDFPRVLILDDDHFFRQTLENIISVKGLEPLPVATGEQALEIVASRDIAVALIDLRLNQMGGLEVLREIRQRSPDTECILLTGHASRETAIQATNQGAYSYIQKPFKTDELLLTIRRAIEKRSSEKALRESEKRNRAIVRALPDILFHFDAESTFLDCRCNDPEMLLLPPEAFIGQTAAQVLPSFLAELVEEHLQETLVSREMQVFRYTLQVKEEERHYEARMVLSDDEQVLAIVRDISEQVRTEQALRESEQRYQQQARELEKRVAERTAQLEQSNQDLEAFAYSVSHDLRAPLRHIDGFVHMLADQIDPKSEAVRDCFAKIDQASDHMHNLIKALLTYSRLGRRELTFVNVSLENLVNKVIKRHQPDLEQREIEWQIGPLDVVYADPYMVEIVFDNLIANAIKFSAHCETARIRISSQPRNGLVDVRVKDNGVGFDMAYADRLFGVFQRLHSDDEFPGTGIGLAIVKRIVRDHNGQVRAQAEPGQGASFTISLPKGVE